MNVISLKRSRSAGLTAGVATAATLLFSAAPAFAGSNSQAEVTRPDQDHEVRSVTVHFADLNTDSRRDNKRLYMRLRNAAQTVCGDSIDYIDLTERREALQCQQSALESAVAEINRPQLTALYNARFPKETLTVASASQTPLG